MATISTTARISLRRQTKTSLPASRFDRRLAEILTHATEVFRKKGYEGASMRDLSRASGMSLAGLYYYFESKERLLYLIQKHTFTTIVRRLKQRLDGVSDPEQRIRIFILNHLEYFLANQAAMKVLSHEADALKNGFASEVAAIKREYYRICVGLLDELKREEGLQFSTRIAVLSLFGMMNWIYTWHNPRVDADADGLARAMGDILLRGIANGMRRNAEARVLTGPRQKQIPRSARNDNGRIRNDNG
jgi:TetR/AcrR family transcriptional regulator, cholesterol catabolism regulator